MCSPYPILCSFTCHQPQVEEITKVAKERVDLAKALIRASEKPAKPSKSKGNRWQERAKSKGEATDATKTGAGADSTDAAVA